jgi:hypothetical protein
MKSWQIIDDTLAHCSKCGAVFTHVELYGGACKTCRKEINEEAKKKLETAKGRVLTKGATAAAKLISAMEQQGKTGQKAPQVLDHFFDEIGGTKKFASLMRTEFEKAHGIGVTEAEAEAWGPSAPRTRLQWYELMARMMDRTDANKTLDISSLQEAELEAILSDLGHKAVLEDKSIRQAAITAAIGDKAFRRELFLEIVRTDKGLADEFLSSGGIVTLETSDNVSPPDEYDPSTSEWNDKECSG